MSDIEAGQVDKSAGAFNDHDAEKRSVNAVTRVDGLAEDSFGQPPLQRQLKSRHIQMISIGGVIGTGLFLGTANGLRHGGPLGLVMGYAVMGTICLAVMLCLGEMVAHLPVPGGHITLGQRFVDPSFSFLLGWNYWYNWTIVLPAELSAAAVLIGYWAPNVNPAAWITVCLVVAVAINFGGTRAYGEAEFWFAIIKVLTIMGLILLGIILDAKKGADGSRIGFRYWHHPGPFAQYDGVPGTTGRFLGFWAVLVQAAFSYIGTEIVAIAAGEAKNPKKSLPKAIKRVYIRIILFYVLGTFIIGLLVASNDPRLELGSGTAAASPFVIAIQNAGIPALPSIINACLLTSAWSAASSDLYTSSRALYGLALNHNAPRFLTRVNGYGLPYVCVLVGVAFSLLSYMSAGATGAGTVFNYFANMTSVCGLMTWAGILYTYIRFYNGTKAQGIDRSSFAFRALGMPYLAYYGLFMCCLVLFFNGFGVFIHIHAAPFDKSDFITDYFPMWFAPILWGGYRLWKRGTHQISYDAMDFYSGSRVSEEEDEFVPQGFIQKAWAAIM